MNVPPLTIPGVSINSIVSDRRVRRSLVSFLDVSTFSALRSVSRRLNSVVRVPLLNPTALHQFTIQKAKGRMVGTYYSCSDDYLESILSTGIDLVRMLREYHEKSARRILLPDAAAIASPGGPGLRCELPTDSDTDLVRQYLLPILLTGDAILRAGGPAIDESMRHKAAGCGGRRDRLYDEDLRVMNEDAEVAVSAIRCGAALWSLEALAPQTGLRGIVWKSHLHGRGQRLRDEILPPDWKNAQKTRPKWYRQGPSVVRSGPIEQLSMPVPTVAGHLAKALRHRDGRGAVRQSDDRIGSAEPGTVRLEYMADFDAAHPAAVPVQAAQAAEIKPTEPTGVCGIGLIHSIEASEDRMEPSIHSDEHIFCQWYAENADSIDKGRYLASIRRSRDGELCLPCCPMYCTVEFVACLSMSFSSTILMTALFVGSMLLVTGPWYYTCIRNALSVGLTAGNEVSAVSMWMHTHTPVRLPPSASVLELVSLVPDPVQRAKIVNKSVEYCNAVGLDRFDFESVDVLQWAHEAVPVEGVNRIAGMVLLVGAAQLALALVYSCMRALEPWSVATVAWTCVMQAAVCGRAGSGENPILTLDRLPSHSFGRAVADVYLSYRTIASLYWAAVAFLFTVARPLADAAELAYQRRQPIPHDVLQSVVYSGTIAGCVAVMLPVFYEFVSHPNRLDQTAKMRVEADHTFWPMTGRRKLLDDQLEPWTPSMPRSLAFSLLPKHLYFVLIVVAVGVPLAETLGYDKFEFSSGSPSWGYQYGYWIAAMTVCPFFLSALDCLQQCYDGRCTTRSAAQTPIREQVFLSESDSVSDAWCSFGDLLSTVPSISWLRTWLLPLLSFGLFHWGFSEMTPMRGPVAGPAIAIPALAVYLGSMLSMAALASALSCVSFLRQQHITCVACCTVHVRGTQRSIEHRLYPARDTNYLLDPSRMVELVTGLAVQALRQIQPATAVSRCYYHGNPAISPYSAGVQVLDSGCEVPVAITLPHDANMCSVAAATAMSARWQRLCAIPIHHDVAESLCRTLDRVLVCMAAMEPLSERSRAARIRIRRYGRVGQNPSLIPEQAGPVHVLSSLAHCLVEVLKQQPHVFAKKLVPPTPHHLYSARTIIHNCPAARTLLTSCTRSSESCVTAGKKALQRTNHGSTSSSDDDDLPATGAEIAPTIECNVAESCRRLLATWPVVQRATRMHRTGVNEMDDSAQSLEEFCSSPLRGIYLPRGIDWDSLCSFKLGSRRYDDAVEYYANENT